MPALPKLTIYTNDGTTVLGSITLINVGHDSYTVYVNDSGISPTETAADGYTYTGPGKWFGVSTSPNTTTAEYGPGTTFAVSGNSNVYAVIGTSKNTVSIDITTLSGYNTLTPNAAYNIQVKAKAAVYEDSDLSNAIRYVASRPVTYPVKGDLIYLGSDIYRVLKINGSIAEVLAMDDSTVAQKFDDSGNSNVYANSSLDSYLTSTFYNSLSTAIQNAIVEKTFQQDSWYSGSNPSAIAKYNGTNSDASDYTVSLMSTTFGASISRKCYVLSCQDVIDYLEVTPAMVSSNTTLTTENVWKMFWNQTTAPVNSGTWLRSADSEESVIVFSIDSNNGILYNDFVDESHTVRPAFQIDLSKVEWLRTIDDGVYQWIDNPNLETAPESDFKIYWSGSTLTANNVYGNDIYYTRLSTIPSGNAGIGSIGMVNTNDGLIQYDGTSWTYVGDDQFTVTDTSKLRTIKIFVHQVGDGRAAIPPKFYDWAITGGNFVKQN